MIRRVGLWSALLVAVGLGGCSNRVAKSDACVQARNKQAVRRLIEQVWNQGNFRVLDETVAPSFVHHDRGPGGEPGERVDAIREEVREMRAALIGRYLIEALVADGDMVGAVLLFRGANKGEIPFPCDNQVVRIPPTNKSIRFGQVVAFRFVGGKIVEAWGLKKSRDFLIGGVLDVKGLRCTFPPRDPAATTVPALPSRS